jgi:hypothetical protein
MIVTVLLLALGFGMTAQAGPRLYEGSLIIHVFGNDTTRGSGTSAPFTMNLPQAFPPVAAHCNTRTFHPKETLTVGTYYNTNTHARNGNYNVFTIPSYGGQVATRYSGNLPIAPGCGDATLQPGSPLTGQGSIHTTGATSTSRTGSNPRNFTLIASDLYRIVDGASPAVGWNAGWSRHHVLWEKRYWNLRNERGVFCKGCGPGRYSSSPRFSFEAQGWGGSTDDDWNGKLGINPGANKFGGTMKLLGTVYANAGYITHGYETYAAKYTWLFDYIGDGADASGSAITAPAFGQTYNYYYGRKYGKIIKNAVQAFALSWTTGTATVSAIGGYDYVHGASPFVTVMARAGFDHRDEHGYGEIQMVSPMLTRWFVWGGQHNYFTGGIGIMRLRFTPEPHTWMLLGAGVSLLGLLYRANRSSR